MKILMVNKFFYRKGGSETYMFDLIKLLRNNGHQVIEFAMKDQLNQASDYGDYFIDHIDFNKRQGWVKDLKKAGHLLYSSRAAKNLERLIKQEKPDIAHLHNFHFQLTPAILFVLKKYNIPVVWTLHDYKLICPNYRLFTKNKVCQKCQTYKYYNCFINKCIKNSCSQSFLAMLEMYLHKVILKSYQQVDIFIAPSKFLQNKLLEWQIDGKNIKQLYYTLDLSNLSPNQDLGQGIIYVGRLSPEKGIITLLNAIKDLPDVSLKIVGTGPQKKQIEKFITDNNLSNVELLGYKSGSELIDLIKQSRLVVVPSIWYENNPLVILEAFAVAKPVIGSDLGGIPELVNDGQTGYLFKAGSANDLQAKIKQSYDNRELLVKMGQQARQSVEQIADPQKHLTEIINIYQSLIK